MYHHQCRICISSCQKKNTMGTPRLQRPQGNTPSSLISWMHIFKTMLCVEFTKRWCYDVASIVREKIHQLCLKHYLLLHLCIVRNDVINYVFIYSLQMKRIHCVKYEDQKLLLYESYVFFFKWPITVIVTPCRISNHTLIILSLMKMIQCCNQTQKKYVRPASYH